MPVRGIGRASRKAVTAEGRPGRRRHGSRDSHVVAAPDIGDDELMKRVIEAWAATRNAKKAEAEAAKRTREVVKELRGRGLSVTV